MADLKISQLTAITTLTPATDVLPVVDVGGVTKKITTNQILGSGGTATLASATITGDLTVDTSTLKVDSTNNRVGVGTAAPYTTAESLSARTTALTSIAAFATMPLTVTDSTAFAAGVGGGINFRAKLSASLYSDYAAIWSQREVATSNDYKGSLIFGTSDNSNGYPIERFSIASTGNVSIANGNVVMTTSGKGIDFSATANGSGTMTSEILNDYEEGTWTGSLLGVTTNPTVPVTATGSYTKVGRIVRISIQFSNVSTVGASGQLTVSGIPFTNSSIAAIGNAFIGNSIVTITGPVFSAVGSGASSNVDLVCQLTSGDTTTADHSAGTGKYLTINTVYTV
jgi:hypothetical protein